MFSTSSTAPLQSVMALDTSVRDSPMSLMPSLTPSTLFYLMSSMALSKSGGVR